MLQFAKSWPACALAAALVLAGVHGPAVADAEPPDLPVRVEIFGVFEEAIGDGIFFGDPLGELRVSAIAFGPEVDWWPVGEAQPFGALLTSRLHVPEAGDYTFTMGSDDASYLFINGALALALPGAHSYYTDQATLTLDAGLHTMELQFYNQYCCQSKLTLDTGGLAYTDAVPEPATLPLWLAGLGLTGWALRRRAAAAAA